MLQKGMDTKIISQDGQSRQARSRFRQELREYDRKGISLWLDGNVSRPKEIEKACLIAEEGSYMRDYVANEKGEICAVRFDKIKEK